MSTHPDPLRLWRWRLDQTDAALRAVIPKADTLHRRRERLAANLQRLQRLRADYTAQLRALQVEPHRPDDAMALQSAHAQVASLIARAERELESAEGACHVADQAVLLAAQRKQQAQRLLEQIDARLRLAQRKQEQRQLDELATQRAARLQAPSDLADLTAG
jgi:flagellar export protein FliJ